MTKTGHVLQPNCSWLQVIYLHVNPCRCVCYLEVFVSGLLELFWCIVTLCESIWRLYCKIALRRSFISVLLPNFVLVSILHLCAFCHPIWRESRKYRIICRFHILWVAESRKIPNIKWYLEEGIYLSCGFWRLKSFRLVFPIYLVSLSRYN